MKKLFFVLFFFSLVFSQSYGPSVIELEKTWTIISSPGDEIELDGIFIVNNSWQKVTSVELSPGAELVYLDDGIIKVRYKGVSSTGEKTVSAKAVVEVLYDTSIKRDAPLSGEKLETTNLTAYDREIEGKADEYADESSTLETIRSVVDWVHNYIEYDITYFGLTKEAKKVLRERRGVCVEYTHLLISVSRSLGIDTRYAGGYVVSEDWQAHSWAELYAPGYGWLPADATFGEVGVIDNSHLIMFYGNDQNDIFDKVTSTGSASFQTDEKLTFISIQNATDDMVDVGVVYEDYTVDVTLENKRDEYVYFVYYMNAPELLDINERQIILLEPNEKRVISYELDENSFSKNVKYTIPLSVITNDKRTRETFQISRIDEQIQRVVDREITETEKSCPLGFVLPLVLLLILKVGK